MNLKSFSLIREDDENYHVGHPSGKSMVVPKKGLSEKSKLIVGQLKKPEMAQAKAEGGPIDEVPPNSESAQDSPDQIIAAAQANAPQQPPMPEAAPQLTAADEQAATQAPPPPMDQGQGNPAPEAPLPGPFNTTQSLNQAKGAVQAGVKGEEKAGREESAAYKQAAQSIGDLESPDDKFARYQKTENDLQNQLASQKIDPQRYWHNMSTGSKIQAGIALALGGFGSGLTGQPNFAAQAINNAISNDIDAQKNEQSKTMNLWRMNREQLGSDQQADLAAQNQFLGIAKVKALQAQAGAQGPLAQQRAAQLALGFDQQIAQNNWMRSRLQGGAPGTEQAHVNDLQVMQNVRPEFYKDMQSKYVPGVGVARVPVSEGDRQALKTYDTLGNSIQQAINFAKTKGTTMYGSSANAEADSIRQNLVTGFQTLHDLKRLSDVDLKYNLSNISSPGALRSQAAIAQFEQLGKELDNKKKVDYNQLGIQPFQKAPQDQAAVAWAQSNPQDPRSAEILARNRGPNG